MFAYITASFEQCRALPVHPNTSVTLVTTHLLCSSITTNTSWTQMPREPPENRIRFTYSKDLRERVVYQRFKLKKKVAAIAVDLNISQRVVERTLKLWRDSREVIPEGSGLHGKRLRLMTSQELTVRISFHTSQYTD